MKSRFIFCLLIQRDSIDSCFWRFFIAAVVVVAVAVVVNVVVVML